MLAMRTMLTMRHEKFNPTVYGNLMVTAAHVGIEKHNANLSVLPFRPEHWASGCGP